MSTRWLGGALVAVGVVAMAAGVAWLAADSGDDETEAAEVTTTQAPTTTTSSTTTTTAPSTTTTTTTAPPAETPQEFFARWVTALASGDIDFLFDRLHPTEFERYDEAACRAYLEGLDAPAPAVEVRAVGVTATWRWETDGLALDVPGATTVSVRRTDDGVSFIEGDVHVVVDTDGVVRWFTDCGTPKEGAR